MGIDVLCKSRLFLFGLFGLFLLLFFGPGILFRAISTHWSVLVEYVERADKGLKKGDAFRRNAGCFSVLFPAGFVVAEKGKLGIIGRPVEISFAPELEPLLREQITAGFDIELVECSDLKSASRTRTPDAHFRNDCFSA